MKILKNIAFYSLSFLILYSCKRNKDRVKIDDVYEIEINSNECLEKKKDILVLFFESDFNDDLVKVTIDQHEIFEDRITTDNTLGLAKEINLGKITDVKEIDFKINDGKSVVLDNLNCNFISVNYVKDSIVIVDFSDKFISYN